MSQMNQYCERRYVEEVAGHLVREGDRISYDVSVYDRRFEHSTTERRVAVIDELWLENHPNIGRPMLYAEVTNTRGESQRVWFHRDHVEHASDLEAALGAQPEGAMF